jgi:hypothetical protein
VREVPEGPLTVARHFNGGWAEEEEARAVGTPETAVGTADGISALPTGR